MLIITPAELAARRKAIAGSPVLSELQQRLRRLVDPLVEGPLYVSPRKAMYSQDGGICPDDGARLEFHPLKPDQHRCPLCGKVFQRERDYLYWLMWYHIWLAERAIHLALLGALSGDGALTARARDILQAYADQYRGYPNQDNLIGPTRLFFSTYLESIWLIEICVAADLLGGGIAEDMIAESASLIRSYDEQWSNRQVWNNTAMIAAGQLLKVPSLVKHGLEGPYGVRAMLDPANQKVSDDGCWYEGENYHFFALRGLQFAAELLRAGDLDLYADKKTGPVLGKMYVAPLLSVYPDLTLPARSDAPFGVSIRQPRFAELWEVGLARTRQPRVAGLLSTLYDPRVPSGPDYGLFELSEQEQNRPPARLSRDLLGWKALLWMDPADPTPGAWEAGSALLRDQGLVVLRDNGRYVSLECGGDHGGHGHPDLLHLSLYWDQHWLVDPGTGSYVRPSLFWYRSTLAHNAPGLADVGQESRNGSCTAFDSQGEWTWCQAAASDLFGQTCNAQRSVLLGPDYVLDVIDFNSPAPVDLPLHPFDTLDLPRGANPQPDPQGLAPVGIDRQTGYDALTDVNRLTGSVPQMAARCNGAQLTITLAPRTGEQRYTAAGWGPADLHFAETGPNQFLVRRSSTPDGNAGRWAQAYALSPNAVTALEVQSDGVHVTRGDGSTEVVKVSTGAAGIEGKGPPILLRGAQMPTPTPVNPPPSHPAIHCPVLASVPAVESWETQLPSRAIHALGADQYRRTEDPYDPSQFSARVGVFTSGRALGFAVTVVKPHRVFRGGAEPNPLFDNDPPDLNSDGVQCYVADPDWQGFLLVPAWETPQVRVLSTLGQPLPPGGLSATWMRASDGYRMLILYDLKRIPSPGEPILVNLVINQMSRTRVRRAGQLVLSRADDDRPWAYGRGADESPDDAALATVK